MYNFISNISNVYPSVCWRLCHHPNMVDDLFSVHHSSNDYGAMCGVHSVSFYLWVILIRTILFSDSWGTAEEWFDKKI